jgi:TonB-dependent SusC/RagA subfamily outer membrane receptor
MAAIGQPHDSTNPPFQGWSGADLVRIGRGAFVIRIHSGLAANGEPLYVIDGAPMMIEPGRGIDWFRPEDISNLRVLTNPAETAVYGPRGVNGVIVIATKQARRREHTP